MNPKKELHRLRCYAYAVLEAMPELEAAHDTLSGLALFNEIERIEKQYGLSGA